MQASFKGRGEVSEKPVGMGVSIDLQDKEGKTALIWASSCGHGRWRMAEKLVGMGASIDLQHKEGKTALIWASF